MIRRLACALPALFAAIALHAPATAQPIDLSRGGPVDITANDGFELREQEKRVIATGEARAVRDNVTVIADRLIARYRKKTNGAAPASVSGGMDTGSNEIYRLEAEGNVRIYTPTDQAFGDRAVYDIDQAVLVMTGHALKLITPQQVLTARDSMEYWSQKHMAVGRGNAVVITADGRRLAADVLVGYTASDGAQPTGSAASGKLQRVEAFGNVEVRTATETVRGDRGLYTADTGTARIEGNVRMTRGQTQLNGPAADVNMKTGIAHMVSGPGQRATGLIVPNDTAVAPGTTAPPVRIKP